MSKKEPAKNRPELAFSVERTSPEAIRIRHVVSSPLGWEQWYLLRADVHHDSPNCDRDLEYRHLAQAVERRAGILDFGDLFDCMGGKYDHRASKTHLRKEYKEGDYFDKLVSITAGDYAEYARNFVLLVKGNHEIAVRDRQETDLTERLAGVMSSQSGSTIFTSGITGWVNFSLIRKSPGTKSRGDGGSGHYENCVLWYHHGYGGGGPVTQDTIQAQRQRAYVRNANIMVSAHTHDSWTQDTVGIELTVRGTERRVPIKYVKLPTYDDAYGCDKVGWWARTGRLPKPKGAFWLRFFYVKRTNQNGEFDFEISEAK